MIEIPEGVTTIGDNAFHGCELLASIVIPGGLTTIGDNECKSLVSIVIPGLITTLGSLAFIKASP